MPKSACRTRRRSTFIRIAADLHHQGQCSKQPIYRVHQRRAAAQRQVRCPYPKHGIDLPVAGRRDHPIALAVAGRGGTGLFALRIQAGKRRRFSSTISAPPGAGRRQRPRRHHDLSAACPYYQTPYYTRRAIGRASNITPSLRVAGPLPFTLPGGKAQLTLNTEINTQTVDATASTNLTNNAITTYTPQVKQTSRSIYGEVAFPILGGDHTLPSSSCWNCGFRPVTNPTPATVWTR